VAQQLRSDAYRRTAFTRNEYLYLVRNCDMLLIWSVHACAKQCVVVPEM